MRAILAFGPLIFFLAMHSGLMRLATKLLKVAFGWPLCLKYAFFALVLSAPFNAISRAIGPSLVFTISGQTALYALGAGLVAKWGKGLDTNAAGWSIGLKVAAIMLGFRAIIAFIGYSIFAGFGGGVS